MGTRLGSTHTVSRFWGWVQQSFSPDGPLWGYALLLAMIATFTIAALIFMAAPVSQIFSDGPGGCLQCTNE